MNPRSWGSSLSSGSQAGAPGDLGVSPSHGGRGDCRFQVSRSSWWFVSACVSGTRPQADMMLTWRAAQAARDGALLLVTPMSNFARTHVKRRQSCLLRRAATEIHEWPHMCPSLLRFTSAPPFTDPLNTSPGPQPLWDTCLDPGPCGSPAHLLVQPGTHCHTFTHSSHKHSHTRLTALFNALISLLFLLQCSATSHNIKVIF